MPTYVYECSKCERTIEVEQRISEDPLKDCECGGKGTLKRIIQPTAVLFKGTGFHINDYSSSTSPDAKADKPEKVDKTDASGKTEISDKAEKPAKPDKPEKTGKPIKPDLA